MPWGFCNRPAGQSCYTHFNLPWKRLRASNACTSSLLEMEMPFQLWNIPSSTTDCPAHSKSAYQEGSQLNLNSRWRLPHLLIRNSNSASYIAQMKRSRHKVYPIASSSHSSVAFIGTGTLYKSSRLHVYRHEGCLWHGTLQTPLKVEKIGFSGAHNPTRAALPEESPGQMEPVCEAHLGIKTCTRWLYPSSKQPL